MKKLFSLFVAVICTASMWAWTGAGTSANPYQISSLADWNTLATNVSGGNTYSGVYFKQTANIGTVTSMVGSSTYKFSGIYDGGGYTLNVNISGGQNAAPFSCISGATIKNVHTTGSVSSNHRQFGGIVGGGWNGNTVINCRSSVSLTGTYNADASPGGVVGIFWGSTNYIEGCLFDGTITTNVTNAERWAGIFGWGEGGSTTITNCLFKPSNLSISNQNGSTTIYRGYGTVVNCYYTELMGSAQGKKVHPITTGTGVTAVIAGTPTASYSVSGLTFYGTNGFSLNGVCYGVQNEAISLNLSYDAPAGYTLDHYNVTNGTLTGSSSPYTFTITADADAAISAEWVRAYTAVMADGTEDASNWSISPNFAPEGTTITLNYAGSRNIESIEIGNSHTYYVNDASELATQLDNFNANPGSRLVLNTNVSTMTITAEEGVIDLNGHTVTSGTSFLLQNNTLGKAITIKNGTIIGMDGAIGWGDVYKGTVILENIYVVNDLYTDGHAYILRNGTYKNVQNFTKNDAPGTVTVYSGVKIVNRNSVGASGGTHAGTFIDLAESAPDITGVTEVVHNAQWTFAMPAHDADVYVTYADFEGSGTESDPYLIPDLAAWNTLAGKVNTGMTYDDKFFRQTGDISGVTAFMGIFVNNQLYNQKPFMGIYDGGGHTLNVNLNASVGFLAPIRCVYDAIIKNMVVTGSVTASSRHASGLVGTLAGPCTVENCMVSTNVSGTDYMGGVIGHCRYDGFTITGTVYNGTLTPTGGNYTGGLIGWGGENVTPYATITNSLFAGTYINSSGGKFHPVGCFGGANATRTISNVYYTTSPINMTNETNVSIVKNPVTYKGERVYSVTAGTGVTVTPVGTPVTSYNVSKLDLYGEDGIAFNGIRYGGQGDAISMNLTHADEVGYSFSNYSADHGTLTGTDNPYSLTMASANTIIDANYIVNQYTITFNSNGGSAVASITQDYGTAITAPADPTRENLVFDGWTPALPATMPAENMELTAQWEFEGAGTEADPYLIPSTEVWNFLCANVKAGKPYTGKHFLQTVDITISERTATFCEYGPEDPYSGVMPYFEGIYDGGGHIMNLDIHETAGENKWIATSAPFGLVRNATFKNMHITGETSTNNMRPASLVGFSKGNNTIINCWSEVAISSYHNNDIDAGAFVARLGDNAHFDITGCLFTGSITYSNASGYEGGGFVGWTRTGSTVTLTDCVFAPSSITRTKKNAFYMFVGGGASHGSINNCYYNDVAAGASLTLTNSTQEKRIHTITPGTGVTVAPAGTPTTYYDVSTIAIYGNNGGLSAGGVLYGKNADVVSMNLSGSSNYKPSAGTLSGADPYTLTMANANTVIYGAASITAAPTDAAHVYSGTEQELVNAGVPVGGTIKYSLDNSSWSAEIPTGKNVGNYTVYYMIEGDATHADFIPSPNTVSATITKAPLTISADEKWTEYGDYTFYEMSYSGFVGSDGPASLSAQPTLSSPYHVGDPVGTYDITLSGGTSANYDITLVNSVLHVNKAPLTVKADDKQTVYGAAAPAFTATITGFVLGEDESVLGGALNFSCAYTVGADLGNYTITPSGLSADNYQFFYQNGTLAVSAPTSMTFADNVDNTVIMEALYGETLDITIGRTFKAGIYNTCCLPFDLSASEIAASPLAGATLKNYNGADVTGTGAERDLNIYLSDLTDIVAGKPFLIKPEADIVNPTFNDVTIAYDELMGENIVADHVDFQGILAPYDLAAYSNSSPDYLGVGATDGRLYWADASKSTGPMRAFRAFFHVKDAGTNNSPVRRGMHAQFVENAPQVTTDVDQITNDQSPMTNKVLRDGILYIERNGCIYTTTGQEVK